MLKINTCDYSKITPTSPKKGKAGTKWEDDINPAVLNYGEKDNNAANVNQQNNDLDKYASVR